MIGIFYLLLIVVNIGTLLYMISETTRCESNYLETIDRLTADVDMKNKTISRQQKVDISEEFMRKIGVYE